MANYFATKTARFRPFSYQEMLAPILALKEDYEKTEKELSDLEDTAAAQAFTFQGSSYEGDYNNYIKSLNSVSENMSLGNYNSDTKRQIKDLRKQFLNTLAPAAQRITKLNALKTEQDTKQANNPFVKFSIDYRDKNEKDITANSTYSTYDLSKVYKQIAEDTLSRISQDYHPQVGNPIKIEGTNSYIVKRGYGLTQEQYEKERAKEGSDLNKFIEKEIQKATQGIKEDSVKKQVVIEVEDIIKSNIGKFESTTVKGDGLSLNEQIALRKFNYEYEPYQDVDGTIKYRKTEQWYKDNGYTQSKTGEWVKPQNNPSYNSGPQNPITISADEITNLLGIQDAWTRRFKEIEESGVFDAVKNRPTITEMRGQTTYSGKVFNPETDFIAGDNLQTTLKDEIIKIVGKNNVNNYMYLYDYDNGHIYILPQKSHKNYSNETEGLPETSEVKDDSAEIN